MATHTCWEKKQQHDARPWMAGPDSLHMGQSQQQYVAHQCMKQCGGHATTRLVITGRSILGDATVGRWFGRVPGKVPPAIMGFVKV